MNTYSLVITDDKYNSTMPDLLHRFTMASDAMALQYAHTQSKRIANSKYKLFALFCVGEDCSRYIQDWYVGTDKVIHTDTAGENVA